MPDRTEYQVLTEALEVLAAALPADVKPPRWIAEAWDDRWLRENLMNDLAADHPARHDRVTFMVWLTYVTLPKSMTGRPDGQ